MLVELPDKEDDGDDDDDDDVTDPLALALPPALSWLLAVSAGAVGWKLLKLEAAVGWNLRAGWAGSLRARGAGWKSQDIMSSSHLDIFILLNSVQVKPSSQLRP